MRWDVKVTGTDRKDAMKLFKRDLDAIEMRLKTEAEAAAKEARETAKEVAASAKTAHDTTPVVKPVPTPTGGFFPLKGALVSMAESLAGESDKEDSFTLHSYGEQSPGGGGQLVLKVNVS